MAEIATVVAPGLNLRAGPSKTAESKDKLTTGDKLEITKRERTWLYGMVIHTKSGKGLGQFGWVDKDSVRVNQVNTWNLAYAISAIVVAVLAAIAWFFS